MKGGQGGGVRGQGTEDRGQGTGDRTTRPGTPIQIRRGQGFLPVSLESPLNLAVRWTWWSFATSVYLPQFTLTHDKDTQMRFLLQPLILVAAWLISYRYPESARKLARLLGLFV